MCKIYNQSTVSWSKIKTRFCYVDLLETRRVDWSALSTHQNPIKSRISDNPNSIYIPPIKPISKHIPFHELYSEFYYGRFLIRGLISDISFFILQKNYILQKQLIVINGTRFLISNLISDIKSILISFTFYRKQLRIGYFK